MATPTPREIVRSLYDAIESGAHGEAPKPHFTDDATTVERPNLIKPRGNPRGPKLAATPDAKDIPRQLSRAGGSSGLVRDDSA